MKFLITSFSIALFATSALASELAQVSKLDCRGALASATLEITSGSLRGLVKGKTFNNNTIQIVEIVTDLPSEEFDAIGGATVGRLGVGQIYILFQKAQSVRIKSSEAAELLHMDSNSDLHRYPVQCQITLQ